MPFPLINSGLPYSYPKLHEDIKTQVLVAGGGITGALCAYYLAEAGVEVVVADARTIGLGSTCASTSLLQYEIDTPLHMLAEKIGLQSAVRSYYLCGEAIHKLEDISRRVNAPFFPRKSLQYASYKKHKSQLEKEYNLRRKYGIALQWLDEKDMGRLFPFSAPAALLSDLGASTDAYLLTHALHQHSLKKGARVYDRTQLASFDHHRRGVTAVTAEGYTIKARYLVYATGYESVNYIDDRFIRLHSTYAVASEQQEKEQFWFENCLIWETSQPYLYMRVTGDRRVLVGGKDEVFFSPQKRDRLLKRKTQQLKAAFLKKFPDIPMNPEYSWCGTFGETKDGLPYIGAYPGLPNGYFALGMGGNGITFSVVAAEIIRDMILGKPNADTELFSFGRK